MQLREKCAYRQVGRVVGERARVQEPAAARAARSDARHRGRPSWVNGLTTAVGLMMRWYIHTHVIHIMRQLVDRSRG